MRVTDYAARRIRISRLEREEQDLRDRVAKQVFALDRAGREHRNDPLYQSLASVLATVRRQLAHAQGNEERNANLHFATGER